MQERVQEAIAGLSPDHRTVVTLHHLEGMPVEEIARVMDCSVGTVKSRLSRARDHLKRKLAGYVEGETLDCRQVQPKIADYSVGLLHAREQEQVANHLTACTTCEREWRQFRAVIGLVERHGSREPPPHLWNGVYNRITAEAEVASPGFWERLLGPSRRLIAGTATGVAAAALLVALSFHETLPYRDDVPGPAAPIGAQMAMAVQRHAMLSGAEPFADQVGLEAYAFLVKDPKTNTNLVR
jgi:hypothetical protein